MIYVDTNLLLIAKVAKPVEACWNGLSLPRAVHKAEEAVHGTSWSGIQQPFH